jgi:hypothetical protein
MNVFSGDRAYSAVAPGFSVSGAETLATINGSVFTAYELRELWIMNEDSEISEQWVIGLRDITPGAESGNIFTFNPLVEGNPSTSIWGYYDLTAETTGKNEILYRWGFNILDGLHLVWDAGLGPIRNLGSNHGLGIELLTTPGAATVVSVGAIIAEIKV